MSSSVFAKYIEQIMTLVATEHLSCMTTKLLSQFLLGHGKIRRFLTNRRIVVRRHSTRNANLLFAVKTACVLR